MEISLLYKTDKSRKFFGQKALSGSTKQETRVPFPLPSLSHEAPLFNIWDSRGTDQ